MVFPKEFILQFLSRRTNLPIEGIFCEVTLFAKKKNNYDFQPPLTNTKGETVISRDYVLEEIRRLKTLWIMDFQSSLDECLDEVRIEVPSGREIAKWIEDYGKDKQLQEIYRAQYKCDLDIARLENTSNGQYKPIVMRLNVATISDGEVVVVRLEHQDG